MFSMICILITYLQVKQPWPEPNFRKISPKFTPKFESFNKALMTAF